MSPIAIVSLRTPFTYADVWEALEPAQGKFWTREKPDNARFIEFTSSDVTRQGQLRLTATSTASITTRLCVTAHTFLNRLCPSLTQPHVTERVLPNATGNYQNDTSDHKRKR